jgi:UDP-N-acetylglucosamine 4,6-dehydratase
MNFLDNASILITGGTGSFGQAFTRYILEHSNPRRIAIFSRDELKQFDLRNSYKNGSSLRWFVGDIRDKDRIKLALRDVDIVVHAAALKQVDTGEYNPMEFIKTNVLGSQNVIEAAIECGVSKVVALSTDKASSPINLYGATKLTADKLFVAANNYGVARGSIFSVVRYGNVVGSRGSVIPYFLKLAKEKKPLTITDYRMTRFCITLEQACKFVIGELFVPRIPSIKMSKLVEIISPDSKINLIGIRPGEKLHEEMISSDDSWRTTKLSNKYIVSPVAAEWGYKGITGTPVSEGFSYRSDTNDQWMTDEEIKKLIANIKIY